MHYALGVDIGGTKVSVTLGNSRGKILDKKLLPTRTGKESGRAIEEIAETLGFLKSSARSNSTLGIGVDIPGPMNPHKGIIEKSPHLHGWQGFPLKRFLEKKLRLPVFMGNDANAAALGEKVFGAGKKVQNFVYLTVSTGIGGGVVLDGKLLLGASYGAGEVGHTIIVPGGERCGCGRHGCLEAYASGTAIARFVREELLRVKSLKILKLAGSRGKVSAEIVAQAADSGDRLALEAYRRAGYYLGIGLANLINVLNPEMLILGGSVMKSSNLLWPSMKDSARAHAWPSLYKACRIVKTKLGDQVGDLGALALVFHGSPRVKSGETIH